jgi:hypothetical protein
MVDPDTFLTILYVHVDDFCQSHLPSDPRPGPEAALTRSELVTLALFSQFAHFPSERAFYRWADRHLRPLFPCLPARTQLNRQVRSHFRTIVAFFHHLVDQLDARSALYELLDGTAVPTRNVQRRGRGWLVGQANLGRSSRLGWYHGFHLLVSVHRAGAITGFGFAPASTKDQSLAENFFALRRYPNTAVPTVGRPAKGYYIADAGFEGAPNHQRWRALYGARVVCDLQRRSKEEPHRLPKAWWRWLVRLRQIVETVYAKLQSVFGLGQERPHDLGGFQARLAAKMALHNFCIWLNRQLGRPNLAFADLIDW